MKEVEVARALLRQTKVMTFLKQEDSERYLKLEHLLARSYFDPQEVTKNFFILRTFSWRQCHWEYYSEFFFDLLKDLFWRWKRETKSWTCWRFDNSHLILSQISQNYHYLWLLFVWLILFLTLIYWIIHSFWISCIYLFTYILSHFFLAIIAEVCVAPPSRLLTLLGQALRYQQLQGQLPAGSTYDLFLGKGPEKEEAETFPRKLDKVIKVFFSILNQWIENHFYLVIHWYFVNVIFVWPKFSFFLFQHVSLEQSPIPNVLDFLQMVSFLSLEVSTVS